MQLWRVCNGYVGYSAVHVLVMAGSEERALELASARFKEEAVGNHIYPETYWTRLEVELLCDDVTQEWAGDVTD